MKLAYTGVVLGIICGNTAAAAQTAEDAIRTTLVQWMADFNAGRADKVCNLFSTDLRYDYRDFPERGYEDICAVLRRALSGVGHQFHYSLVIKNIDVSGDLGVAHVVWTLTTKRDDQSPTRAKEYSMDVFRRQADGTWKLVRFLAYEAP